MVMTDPIADMLARIRNAAMARKDDVILPSSSLKERIAEILAKEGYVVGASAGGEGKGRTLTIRLKYGAAREPSISGLRRISKPGQRVYAAKDEVPRVLGGLGIAILSTSRGIVTDRQARRLGVGGEVLAYVW
jgi:small subunit ribosomal protein S8